MDKIRKGEIALLFLKYKLGQGGFPLGKNTKRDIACIAREIGIRTEEALEFAELVTRELVNDIFVSEKEIEEPTTSKGKI